MCNINEAELNKNNLGVMSLAMTKIRNTAEKSRYLLNKEDLEKEELLKHIQEIIKISDSLHNVGSFMAKGISVDAQYLLAKGVDENWPTGIIENKS